MRQNRTKYQSSDRDARPVKVKYWRKHELIAAEKLTVISFAYVLRIGGG